MKQLSANEISQVNGSFRSRGFYVSNETKGCIIGGASAGILTSLLTRSPIAGYLASAGGCYLGSGYANSRSYDSPWSPAMAYSYSTGCINSSSSSCSSSSRVICTHFFRKGMIEQKIWRADLEFTFKNLSPAVVRGYHVWAIPYVRLMRKSSLAEKIMFPLAKYRAIELAHKMGVAEKGSLRGKIIRAIGEPICFMIGVMAKEQNWESLWKDSPTFVTGA